MSRSTISTIAILALAGSVHLPSQAQENTPVTVRAVAPPPPRTAPMVINPPQVMTRSYVAHPKAAKGNTAPLPVTMASEPAQAATVPVPSTSQGATPSAAPEFSLNQPGVPAAVRDQAAQMPVTGTVPEATPVSSGAVEVVTNTPPPPVFQTMKQAAEATKPATTAPTRTFVEPEPQPHWADQLKALAARYQHWWPAPVGVVVFLGYLVIRRRRANG